MAMGIAVMASALWLWLHNVPWALPWGVVGLLVMGFGIGGLMTHLRRSPALRRQEIIIRQLWLFARRLPAGVYVDPAAGTTIRVERERAHLIIAVTEPGADQRTEPQVVTRYELGFLGVPNPPPLLRHVGALHDRSPARMSLPRMTWLWHFNKLTGALESSNEELTEVQAQLSRAVAATRESAV